MDIIIFHRKSDEDKLTRFCVAEFISQTDTELTFSTQEWIPVALGSLYYVRITAPDYGLESCREIDVYKHSAVKPSFIYTVELLGEWRGFLKDEETKRQETS